MDGRSRANPSKIVTRSLKVRTLASDGRDNLEVDATVERWVAEGRATLAHQFGWRLLLDGRRAFAVVADGRFGVKLPKPRRQELAAQGIVEPLIDHQGRALSEWVTILDVQLVEALLEESRQFVRGLAPVRRRRKRS
jgi:hypothetical protein